METNDQIFQFKTNLNCGGCVSKIKPDLDNADGICEWKVDTDNRDKLLTVKSCGITEDEVMDIIHNKGLKAERVA